MLISKPTTLYEAQLIKCIDNALKIEDSKRLISRENHTNRAITAHVHKLTSLTLKYIDKPKKIVRNGKEYIIGYHIMSYDLQFMRNNNSYAKEFLKYTDEEDCVPYPHFRKVENSTYHKNSATYNGYNGYAHWYTFPDYILKALNDTNEFLKFNNIDYEGKYFTFEGKTLTEHEISDDEALEKVESDEWFRVHYTLMDDFLDAANDKDSQLRLSILKKMKSKTFFDNVNSIVQRTKCKIGEWYYIDNVINTDKTMENGREYTLLGCMHKVIRKTILRGYKEIDISSSVQSILMNSLIPNIQSNKEKVKEHFPEASDIIFKKDEVRSKIAKLFKCSIDEAKTILLSLTFAPRNRYIYTMYSREVTEILNGQFLKSTLSPKAKWIIKKEMLNVRKDTYKLRALVLEKYYFNNKTMRTKINKLLGITDETELKEKHLKKILFRIYEQLENGVRSLMKIFIRSKGIFEVHQVHDCVIFQDYKNSIDEKELMRFLSSKGFDLHLQCETY